MLKELHSRLYYKKLRKECEWAVHSKRDSSSKAVFLFKIMHPVQPLSFADFLNVNQYTFQLLEFWHMHFNKTKIKNTFY